MSIDVKYNTVVRLTIYKPTVLLFEKIQIIDVFIYIIVCTFQTDSIIQTKYLVNLFMQNRV